MKKLLVILLIAFFSMIFMFAYYSKTIENNNITKIQIDIQKTGTINHTVSAEGTVLADRFFSVRSDRDVTIDHVFVNKYEYVKNGDSIVVYSDGTVIASPYDGFIVDLFAVDGQRIYAGDIIFSVSDPESKLVIQINVPIVEINHINSRSTALAEIYQNKHYNIEKITVPAKIKNIITAGDYAIISLNVDNNSDFVIGSTSLVEIGSFSETYYTIVPVSALNPDINDTYVMFTALEIDGANGQRFTVKQNYVSIIDSNDSYAAINYVVPDGYYIVTHSSNPISSGEEVGLGY